MIIIIYFSPHISLNENNITLFLHSKNKRIDEILLFIINYVMQNLGMKFRNIPYDMQHQHHENDLLMKNINYYNKKN